MHLVQTAPLSPILPGTDVEVDVDVDVGDGDDVAYVIWYWTTGRAEVAGCLVLVVSNINDVSMTSYSAPGFASPAACIHCNHPPTVNYMKSHRLSTT